MCSRAPPRTPSVPIQARGRVTELKYVVLEPVYPIPREEGWSWRVYSKSKCQRPKTGQTPTKSLFPAGGGSTKEKVFSEKGTENHPPGSVVLIVPGQG